jgi:amino acid adenylation domain-containing protein/non-ribosomal peptide synthase protein (TIGR01720 family)
MSSEQAIFAEVAALIETISGVGTSDLGRDTDLLDLGLDSLMFVRIGRVLESKYQVSISMKRFYDELSNLGALAAFLEANGTQQEVPANPQHEESKAESARAPAINAEAGSKVPLMPALPVSAPSQPGSGADLHAVMSAHMALMRRYLDGVAGTSAPFVPSAARPPAPVARAQAREQSDAIETRKKFSGIVTQKEDLSAAQREFIRSLAERLSARCARSKQLAEDSRTCLADWKYSLQFKQDLKELRFPIVCDTASGAHFTDVDGNEYVDIAMGMGVHYFGHSPRFVDEAVKAQLDKNLALGPQARLAAEVARKLCALTGHERAAFFVTGSDAVMLALRLVRAARARSKVVIFAGAYHGICSDVLAGQGETGAIAMSPGLPPGIVDDLVVLDYDAPESLDRIRAMADELAGVLVEPVQSRNPALQPQRFLRQLRAVCTEHAIPLIFDEMVNGFRQAGGGMQEWFGVEADLSTYGKIIGGGYPLSVIAGKAALMQWIDGGVWHYGDDSAPHADSIATGGTHNKHPVALAAAAAVLEHIERNPQMFDATRMHMHRLADRLNVWFEGHAVPLRLTYFGTQFKFESFTTALELELFFYLLLEQGIYTWELHVANLSTAHTQDDANRLFAAVVHAVTALRAGGFAFRNEKLRRQYLPMASVQKRLYAITQREGAEKPYHLAGAWRLQGNVDAARLEDCIHQVIIRHESLRTAFVVVDGEFYQRIVPEPRFFLDRIDARGRSAEALLDAYIAPFNLLEPPLIRVGLGGMDDGTQLLLVDVHHIAADGLSMNVVLQEILALYDGERLAPVRAQARHVQDAVARYLAGAAARDDARYWTQTLAPFLAAQESFDLSPDFSRPQVSSFAGKRLALKLDAESTAALHRFCKATRISTFGVLFAVFVAWNYRYARQPRFIVGLPGSGRPASETPGTGPETDGAVGMFVNTLAFPASVDEQSSVADFLRQIRDTLFAAQEHGDYPFGALLAELHIGHGANRNPLFDVMFSYENAGSRTIRTRAFTGETLTQYEGAGMFDVSLDLIEAENTVLINCAYLECLFSEATMTRRITEYIALLQALIAGEGDRVADWALGELAVPVPQAPAAVARPAVGAPVLAVVGEAHAAFVPQTVVTMWNKQVARGAHDIALIEGARQLRYGDVDALVRETAFTLFNLYGVRAGDRILVSLDSSIDLVVVMLALFTMGAVYVPVTPDTPLLRVRNILRRCGARHLVHAQGNAFAADIQAAAEAECIAIAALNDSAIATVRHQSLLPPTADDIAYVIFTSGSTGEPKGVEIAHAGIGNAVDWRIRAYGMGRADATLQMPSAAFDASLLDILCALVCGGRLVLLDTASKRSVERIDASLRQHAVTNVLLTPTLYRVLLERVPATIAALRFITLAGEKLPHDLVRAHFARAPAVALWNEYGPTECSVVVSGGRLAPGQDRVTIGAPVANTQVHILDERERPTPPGVWGRLWVSGIGLARGYAGDAMLTQKKFRRLATLGNVRCYDTGDIVRLLDSGELEFKGRDDGQVKVNGYRVELEEVESALRRALDLTEVAVKVVDKGTSASLHGWVVAATVPADWRERLLAVLPSWMVPTALHGVDELPLLPSGKLNRLALVVPETRLADVTPKAAEHVPASASLETLLAYCRDILGRPDLSAADNYFNAGGDSIQAIVLASRLSEAGHTLDVNDLFRYPVLAELAHRIGMKGAKQARVLDAADAALPTPMQTWFFETCTGDANAFTQAAWVRLPAAMTLAQLDRLCRHWASQHPVFRQTRALMAMRTNGRENAVAADNDVRCSESAADSNLDALAVQARAEIELQHGPLLRVVLVRDAAQVRALVVFHHFAVDAVSWQILQVQWAQLWEDIEQGNTLRALSEGATLHQFASALQGADARQKALQELPFWQSMLADADRTAETIPVAGAQRKRLELGACLDPELAEVLLASGHEKLRTRGSELLLAVFADAIAGVFGLEAVTLLMESNGRAQRYADADFATTVGWMTSAYPLTIAVPGTDWPATVERVRERTRRVPEQGVGYGVLRHVVRDATLARVSPRFAFNYLGRFQHHPDRDFAILDEVPAGDRLGELGLLAPLEFVCFADDAGLHVTVSADAASVGQDRLDRTLLAFRERAASLAACCRTLAEPVAVAPVDFVDASWSLDDYLRLLAANGLARGDVADLVPLTPMQSGLIFHARNRPGDLAYLEQVDFTLHGVEAGKLAQAFQHLLEHFPLLRAAFIVGRNGRTAQLVANAMQLPVIHRDISALTPQEQQCVLDEARAADQAMQFDIAKAPLMRVMLFTLSPANAGGKVHVIWTHHHLLMDGWCVGILFDHLKACYGQVAPVAAQPLNADYFRWLAARDKLAAAGYWATLLAGVEGPTRLMPWREDPESGDTSAAAYRPQSHAVAVPAALTAAMQAWGASRSATLSSVMRLAWGVLLARFTNSADVVYGSVVSGRPAAIAGIDRAVGLFINTVPVRFQLDATTSANIALSRVQEQANASRDHEYLALAEIQDAAPDLRPREALFDHLLAFENYPMDAALRGAGDTSAFGISDIRAFERTDLPLNIVIVPQGKNLEVSFLFDAAVYPSRQIEHLAAHYVQLLQQLVQAPDQALASLNLLTAEESAWLHDTWNARQADYPRDRNVFDLFQDAATRNGARIALQDDDGSMTYAELHARVQATAAGLLRCDQFAPGRRVALWLPRNREMIVGMLAVLAAGGCYVALDPIYPVERIRFIVQDSAAALVLSSVAMPAMQFSAQLIALAAFAQSEPTALPAVAQDASAYVIYTSGSTGQPKGCAISHRNVVRLLRNSRFDFDFDHNDVWVLAHSFCFDFSVWEMYGALLNGGTLVIPAAAQVRDTEAFVALVAERQVTVLNQTPAAFYQFIKAALKLPAAALDALRLVVFGGDALATNRLAPWIEAFPPECVKLVNMYGITETTVHVSYKEIGAAEILEGASVNCVGRPLPETEIWIADRFGRLQPPGIAGEIVVGGSGVGLGYLNRDELTARKFAPLDTGRAYDSAARYYWSGDVGYISPAHGLVYLGRNDHQVQVRGFRVECEEIARCYETHQSVTAALVVPIENAHGTELAAYLTGDATGAPAQWRPWLSTRLPDYMIPAYVIWLDALPLTGNGKIDRAALPDPFTVVTNADSDEPDALEATVIRAWKLVLEHDQIGPGTNFFDIGGHSLKALTLADLLQTEFGLLISVADIFECPTPRLQARRCVTVAAPHADDLAALVASVGLDELETLLADVSGGNRQERS